MNIEEYIQSFGKVKYWFKEEVRQQHHYRRILNVLDRKDYLDGKHKIHTRKNSTHKGQPYITTKLVIQYVKPILNFMASYVLGRPVTLAGSETMVKVFQEIYRNNDYEDMDYRILDSVNKYGDIYEYIYLDKGLVKSHIITADSGYPVYNSKNELISFIEHYIDANSSMIHYIVYHNDRVEEYESRKGDIVLVDTKENFSGLPIHYHNYNDQSELEGRSELDDIVPIIDVLEDIFSKYIDGLYIYGLSPLPIAIGQRIESAIDSDEVGYVLNLEDGANFKLINSTMDYNSFREIYNKLMVALMDISQVPSVALNNANINNVSETTIIILYSLATGKAQLTTKWLRKGFRQRFDKIRRLLELQGNKFNQSEYIDVEFQLNTPVATGDIVQNLDKLRNMGVVSKKTIQEIIPYIKDVSQENQRLNEEKETRTD